MYSAWLSLLSWLLQGKVNSSHVCTPTTYSLDSWCVCVGTADNSGLCWSVRFQAFLTKLLVCTDLLFAKPHSCISGHCFSSQWLWPSDWSLYMGPQDMKLYTCMCRLCTLPTSVWTQMNEVVECVCRGTVVGGQCQDTNKNCVSRDSESSRLKSNPHLVCIRFSLGFLSHPLWVKLCDHFHAISHQWYSVHYHNTDTVQGESLSVCACWMC